MKIIHTADWHIGKSLNNYSLLGDQKYWLSCFIEKLKEVKPDVLVVAGDIYDRSVPSSDSVSLLNDTLSEIVLNMHIRTILIAGNHDSKQRLSFANEFLSKSGLFIVGDLSNNPMPVSIENVDFWPIPYIEPHNVKIAFPNTQPKSFTEAYEIYIDKISANIDTARTNIAVAHGTFLPDNDGLSQVGGSDSVNIDVFSCFDFALLGHFHGYTKLSSKVMYSGSPLKYSVNEAAHLVGFNLINIDKDKTFKIERLSVTPLHDLKILNGSFDSFIENRNIDDDYIFINLEDQSIVSNAMSRLKAVFPNILGLKYINIQSATFDINYTETVKNSALSDSDLFKKFYREVTQNDMSKSETEYVESVFEKIQGEHS